MKRRQFITLAGLLGCWALILATVAVSAQAAKPSVDAAELYQRVSGRLMGDWRRMPHYTCLQDVTRRHYRSDLKSTLSCQDIFQKRAERKHGLPLLMSDHLDLEVAVADHREVHSWPGESFVGDEDEFRDIVGNGAFGSGDFAAFVGAIFGGSAKVIYERERIVDDRRLYEYSFQVSKNDSLYEVESTAGPVITGYSGWFLLDPESEDLVHLSVGTAELPVFTNSCQAMNEIEYGRSEIHGMRVLIPRETNVRVILRTGDEVAIKTSYSSCRQFGTQSKLLLDSDATRPNNPTEVRDHGAATPAASTFPPGLKFKCRILTPIDSDTPAGRPIEGFLQTAILSNDGTVLAPRGAKVTGRVVRMAQHFGMYDYFELAVRFKSVSVRGIERPLAAGLQDQSGGPLPPKAGYDPNYPPAAFASTNLLANSGEFFFVQEHLHLRNLDSEWVTLTPKPKNIVNQEAQIANKQRSVTEGSNAVAAGLPKKLVPGTNPAAGQGQIATSVPVIASAAMQNEAAMAQNPAPTVEQQSPHFRLRVESNLVLVRVVVRDSQGTPIGSLKKEDFELFDKGKRQEITQFEMVTASQESLVPAAKRPAQPSPPAASSSKQPSFLALYFDDLNPSDADLSEARDAAERYLGAGLPANEQVAIFTSNGPLTDFTADPKQILAALAKLRASPRSLSRGHDCPELTDFQAQQITQFQDDYMIDAWKAAIDEVKTRCQLPQPSSGSRQSISPIYNLIRMQARQVLEQAQVLARSNVRLLEQVVDYLAQFPGQRTVVLVSPGFLSESEQAQLDRIINRALREQVVISALDPKGLPLLMREQDVTRSYSPAANSGVIGATHNVDFMREAAASDVMMELADGTGGKFFHNNNDLQAGFTAVSGSTTYYILAFVPGPFDGKFHKLEVRLTKAKGSIQARRGYFSVKNAVETASPELAPQTAVKDDLQRMMSSREEVHDLKIAVTTEVVPSSDQIRDLNVVVRLDLASVPFRKDGDRNLNTLIFVAGIYDNDGSWINGEKKQVDLKLPDSELQDMQTRGVGVRNTFKLKSGRYLLRAVVQDTEDHHIAALNQMVEVP